MLSAGCFVSVGERRLLRLGIQALSRKCRAKPDFRHYALIMRCILLEDRRAPTKGGGDSCRLHRRFLPGGGDRAPGGGLARRLRASWGMTQARIANFKEFKGLAQALMTAAGQEAPAGRKPLPGDAFVTPVGSHEEDAACR
jgi:hypothetical protein